MAIARLGSPSVPPWRWFSQGIRVGLGKLKTIIADPAQLLFRLAKKSRAALGWLAVIPARQLRNLKPSLYSPRTGFSGETSDKKQK